MNKYLETMVEALPLFQFSMRSHKNHQNVVTSHHGECWRHLKRLISESNVLSSLELSAMT